MPKKIIFKNKICSNCGRSFNRSLSKDNRLEATTDFRIRKFCSRKCYGEFNTGEHHWLWKGGTRTRPDGYIRDSRTDQYIHRKVMEDHLGRKLTHEEHIHHIDGNKGNNSVNNLMIVSNSEHRKLECLFAKRDSLGRFSID